MRDSILWMSRLTVVLGICSLSSTVSAQSAKSLEERGIGQGRKQPEKVAPPEPALQLRPGSNEARVKADAESGNAQAMYEWGLWLEQGVTGKPDLESAVKWFKAAAEKDHPAAKTALGNAYYYGRGVDKDLDRMFEWYNRAAEANDPTGMHNLGVIFEHGVSSLGIDKDEAKAIDWYTKSSDANLSLAKSQSDDDIGRTLSYFAEQSRESIERIKRNRKLIAEAAQKLGDLDASEIQTRAKKGDAAAMYELVTRYEYGLGGIEKDASKGLEWLQKAADKDFPSALTSLGLRYFRAEGVEKDEARSFTYIKKAADLGDAYGINNLADSYYLRAGGMPQDRQMALDLYVQAAELNQPYALAALGDWYRDGWIASVEPSKSPAVLSLKRDRTPKLKYVENGTKDWESAIEWYRKAAELDHRYAMIEMGRAYQNGTGVELNPDIAYEWYQAAGSENENAKKRIRFMALQDGCSAIATQSEALQADRDDPDKSRLFAAAIGNSYFGQGGAKKYVNNAKSLLTMSITKVLSGPELAAIAMKLGNDFASNRNDFDAFEAFGLAEDCDEPRALMNQGFMYSRMDPSVIPEAPEKAEKYYQQGERMAKAAGIELHRGRLNYSFALRSGPFVPKYRSAPSANQFVKPSEESIRLAEQGDADACYQLGRFLWQEGEVDKSIELLKTAAEKGHAKSMISLGSWYIEQDTVLDFERAIDWYVKAGDAGHDDGYALAGDAYERIHRFYFYGGIEYKAYEALAKRLNERHDLKGRYDGTETAYMMLKYLKMGAEKGNAMAMRSLGSFYWKRYTDANDSKNLTNLDHQEIAQAKAWFLTAAEKGDVDSMRQLALNYRNGILTEKNLDEALKWSKAAMAAGNVEAITVTASLLLEFNTAEADKECVTILSQAIEANPDNNEAVLQLAWCKSQGRGCEKDLPTSIAICKRLAWQGYEPAWEYWKSFDPRAAYVHELRTKYMTGPDYAESAYAIARAYQQGDGAPREPALTKYWVSVAVAHDPKNFEYIAHDAWMTATGEGCLASPSYAQKLLAPGVEANDTASMRTTAQLLSAAKGFPCNDEMAQSIYKQLSDGGDVTSMTNLAWLYNSGLGSPRCQSLACEYWRTAAEKNHFAPNMNVVATLFEAGIGVPLDKHLATRWFFRASKGGSDFGKQKFEELAAKLLGIPDSMGVFPGDTPRKARLQFDEVLAGAEQGNAKCMFDIGRMHIEGIGYEPDFDKGISWIEKSASSGDIDAQRYLTKALDQKAPK